MSGRKWIGAAAILAAAGILVLASGCHGIPKGTTKDVSVGTLKLQSSGAGLVKADAQKTVYKVKCTICGFESFDMTIDTPTAVRPYSFEWTCPKCGHKQTITVKVVTP